MSPFSAFGHFVTLETRWLVGFDLNTNFTLPTGALDSASSARLLDTMDDLNHDMGITILMVTHDAFTASHCSRILFLRDGHIFTEMRKGNRDRKTFFQEILDVMSMLGGDVAHVR